MTSDRRRGFQLDPTLEGVNALCERWAEETWEYYSTGAVNPIYRLIREAEGAPLPSGLQGISNDTLALDQILATCEDRYRLLVVRWYRYDDSVDQKARKLGLSRAQLYQEWRRVLEYLRGRLHAMGINV